MADSKRTVWSPFEEVYSVDAEQTSAFRDEFGEIDVDIYQAAGEVWRKKGEGFALSTLHDAHAGVRLLLRAAADVTRRRREPDADIENLGGYLWRSYKRRVLEELEKENEHRRLELLSVPPPGEDRPDEDLHWKILVQQVERRMEASMKEVYQYLVLGFKFADIGKALQKNPRALKKRFDRQLARLVKQLRDDHEKAARRSSEFNRHRFFTLFNLSILLSR